MFGQLQRSIQAAKLDAEAAFKNATGMEKTLRDLDAKRAESEKWVRELKAAHEKLDEKARLPETGPCAMVSVSRPKVF